jgi:hypothetical protein
MELAILTDEDIKENLKQFISNIKARRPKLLDVLDLRMLHNITYAILQKERYQGLPELTLINNVLIFNATRRALTSNNPTDAILLNVIENKDFLG